MQPPTSEPPEMLMIGQRRRRPSRRASHTRPGLHGSPSRRGSAASPRSCSGPASFGAGAARPRIRLGLTPSDRDRVLVDQLPDPVGRVAGAPSIMHGVGAERAGGDDLPGAHDPAEVGDPAEGGPSAEVDVVGDVLGDRRQRARVGEHGALRLAGAAARVDQKRRVVGLDRLGLTAGGSPARVVPVDVARPSAQGIDSSCERRQTSTCSTPAPARAPRRRSPSSPPSSRGGGSRPRSRAPAPESTSRARARRRRSRRRSAPRSRRASSSRRARRRSPARAACRCRPCRPSSTPRPAQRRSGAVARGGVSSA